MNKKDVQKIIDKESNKIAISYAIFVVILILIDLYYQQQLSSLMVMTISISISLGFATIFVKSTLTALFSAHEKEAKDSDDS